MKLRFKLFIILIVLIKGTVYSQTSTDLPRDEQLVTNFLQQDSLRPLSQPERIIQAAFYLLKAPYVASSLEINDEEQLVVNLRELDCLTLVENCMALSRSFQYPVPDFDLFCRELKQIRYRDGIVNGYTSRLHYTSDWISDNVRKNVLEDVTHALGGKRLSVKVSFMSTHPDAYPALKNHPEEVAAIRKIEEQINTRHYYSYIPKQEIREKQAAIKNGDIICFTTSLPGLDISHLGIAYWKKGELTFIHASTKAKKVIVNPESLADYCVINKSNTGIMVLRARE